MVYAEFMFFDNPKCVFLRLTGIVHSYNFMGINSVINTTYMYAPLQHRPKTIQPKLEIGQPNDQYEQEADAVADRVVGGSNAPALQMKNRGKYNLQMAPLPSNPMVQMKGNGKYNLQMAPLPSNPMLQMEAMKEEEEKVQMQGMDEEEDMVQMKCTECEEEEKVQKKPVIQMDADGTAQASPELASQLSANKGKGQALGKEVQQDIGNKMGVDLSGVNIHTDSTAAQLSQDLGAKAFTHGNDIYFNERQYNPSSSEGKHLLAHELTHTVQQSGGRDAIQRQTWGIDYRCREKMEEWVRENWMNPIKNAFSGSGASAFESIKAEAYTHINETVYKTFEDPLGNYDCCIKCPWTMITLGEQIATNLTLNMGMLDAYPNFYVVDTFPCSDGGNFEVKFAIYQYPPEECKEKPKKKEEPEPFVTNKIDEPSDMANI